MLTIMGKRDSGKTTAIIELCNKFKGLLIVNDDWAKKSAERKLNKDCIVIVYKNDNDEKFWGYHCSVYIDVCDTNKLSKIKEAVKDVGEIKAITVNIDI